MQLITVNPQTIIFNLFPVPEYKDDVIPRASNQDLFIIKAQTS
jgi:hypothetical protein